MGTKAKNEGRRRNFVESVESLIFYNSLEKDKSLVYKLKGLGSV